MFVNCPSALDPTLAPDGRHVFSLEVLYTPYALAGGWADSRRTAALAGSGRRRVAARVPRLARRVAGDDPRRYEREFHLPHGHATSFAGGPLAALRNKNPELTRYETAVKGLYLTGAATFPGAGVWGASGRNAALAHPAAHGRG